MSLYFTNANKASQSFYARSCKTSLVTFKTKHLLGIGLPLGNENYLIFLIKNLSEILIPFSNWLFYHVPDNLTTSISIILHIWVYKDLLLFALYQLDIDTSESFHSHDSRNFIGIFFARLNHPKNPQRKLKVSGNLKL